MRCCVEWLNWQVRLQAELNILREQLEREKQKAVEEEERKEGVTREELEETKQVRNITNYENIFNKNPYLEYCVKCCQNVHTLASGREGNKTTGHKNS